MPPPHDRPDDGTRAILRLVAAGAVSAVAVLSIVVAQFIGAERAAPATREERAAVALALSESLPEPLLRPASLRLPPGEPDRQIAVPDGFVAELVHAVPRDRGSWVAMTVDSRGRLIASAQDGGLFRITPMPVGEGFEATQVEPIDSPAGSAQGLAVVGGDLYAVVAAQRAEGPGLYRLRDTNGDDRFDETTLLRRFTEGGEHGPHGIVQGPDGLLYVIGGNHTPIPSPERSLVPRLWGEDHLLPRMWDANGHAVGILAPGGWICRTDRDGTSFELVAIGMRNCYDLAFDRDGRLFTYDSDMEWDMGAPWYRPTRLCLVASGADLGWRSGTGNWPPHYADSLPGVLDLGPGSPTGLEFGDRTGFPEPWRSSLFALDWTFGTIRAVRFAPSGAAVHGVALPFMTGVPLPVADAVANPADGALYVVVGGRGVGSAIYRVRWVGPPPSEPARPAVAETAAATARRRLEALHRPDAPAAALEEIWPLLDSDDRFVRFAARTALEHQPLERWLDRVPREPDGGRRIAAVVAAARCAGAQAAAAGRTPDGATPAMLHAALDPLFADDHWDDLDRRHQLDLLRARALCFTRLGRPDGTTARRMAERLEAIYPSGDDPMDRELCDLLVYLGSPVVVARTVPLMERGDASAAEPIDTALLSRSHAYGDAILRMAANQPQRQQVHYALALRCAERGWTPDLRQRYFNWFESARRTSGGMSFAGFLDNIRADALARVPEPERTRYASAAMQTPGGSEDRLVPQGPGRAWTVDEVVALAEAASSGRSHENGRRMFAAALCIDCHQLAGEGRLGGPELTTAASRFGLREIAEALVEPSRVVSDQHGFTEFRLADDRVVIGRVVGRESGRVRVMANLLAPEAVEEIAETAIVSERPSTVSPMPAHLLDPLGPEEVKDLIALLLAGGDPRSPRFAK